MINLVKILLFSVLIQFGFSNEKIHRDNTLLFSLYKEVSPFVIDQEFRQTNDLDFNKFIIHNNIEIIEQNLTHVQTEIEKYLDK